MAFAQKMHAPNLVAVFEFGGTGAQLKRLPRAVGESRTFYRAVIASGICDVMETATRGFIDYGFLGGAQIDAYGNLNSTVIGDHAHPKVRLPGSGGGVAVLRGEQERERENKTKERERKRRKGINCRRRR